MRHEMFARPAGDCRAGSSCVVFPMRGPLDFALQRGIIMIRYLAAALCVIALPAAAQSAYKCSDGKSGSVYQSTPCAAGTEQKRFNAPATSTPAAAPRTGQPSLGAQVITFSGQPSPEACTRHKYIRDQALADASMKGEREFHDVLQQNVAKACR